MPRLFKLQNPERDNTNIYARDPQHIIDLVQFYRGQLSPESLDDPNLQGWVSTVPSLDDIAEVESGHLLYHEGIVYVGEDRKDKDLFLHIPLGIDFTLHVSREGLPYFDIQREGLPNNKRGKLYKFHCQNSVFGSQNFIPEDVMRAIVDLDILPWYALAKHAIENAQSAVDGLHSVVQGVRVSFSKKHQ